MSLPTGTDVQAVDPVLTNMLVGYMNADSRFIADRAFPGVPVPTDSGTYYQFDKKYFFLDDAKQRAYGANFAEAGFGVSTATYTTLQYAISQAIAREVRANSQVPMDLEQAALRRMSHLLLIRKERMFASDFMATSVWGTDATGGSTSDKWSTYASSDPVADVLTGKRTISQSTGYNPNVMSMGEIVRDKLLNHPDLLDRIKYTQTGSLNNMDAALAGVFGLDEILVGYAIYNSANEGQTASMSAIIDDDALLMYRAPSPGIFDASAGYTFFWQPGGGLGSSLDMFEDKHKRADVMQAQLQIDQKAVSTDCGYFFSDYVD